MLSYLDYLVFLHAVFCTEQLYAFRRIIFSMFLRKKKLKKTCPFCMGYRLTKMEDLQNALISRLFGVFARGFLHRTTLCIPQNHFQHVFAKKKVENNLPILHGLQTYINGGSSKCSHISTIWCFCTRFFAQNISMHSLESFSACFCKKKVENNVPILHGLQTYQNGGSSKCSHISTIWCFCTRFFAQNNSMHSVESFSACFCEKKKLKITCPFCMGYILTKMEDLQNALISRLFGVFARAFLHRTTLRIPQNHFQHVFAKKKVKKITCPVCMGYRLTKMEDLQNALISRLFGVFARAFLHRTTLWIPQNHFQHVFAKKKVENNLPILHGLQTYQNGGSSKCSHISTIWCFCTRSLAQKNSMHSIESFSACFCEKKS